MTALSALLFAAALLLAAFPSATKAKGNRYVHGGGGSRLRAWRVTAPVSYKNLTLFPIVGASTAPADSYITLDEGIKNGTVVISEKGSRQVARRTRRGRTLLNQQASLEASGDASVNELMLTNRSGKKLLLLAGEVIVGGKQDRIVEGDLIVPPVSVPISLSVFCVEHGRWSHRTERASSGGGRAETSIVAPVMSAPENFSSLGAISHPKLRAAAQDKKQQSEVWKEVSENNSRLGTANTTDTYQEVYKSEKVSATMEQYISALQKEVLAPGVVGVVVARNGELVWVDAFASPALFAKYWPKLLKSYVVDAMSEQHNERRPTIEQAQLYLSQRDGTPASAGRDGIYRLLKTEHSSYAVFRLEDISLPSPLLLHFNKMQR
jgi:hypothetical protein